LSKLSHAQPIFFKMNIKEDSKIIEFKDLLKIIEKKRFVPVIGNELVFIKQKKTTKEIPIMDFLARELALKILRQYNNETLQEIASIGMLEQHAVYKLLRDIYEEVGTPDSDYYFDTRDFERLSEIRKIRIFLSISFTDLLQKCLEKSRGADNVKVIDYSLTKISDIQKPPLSIREDQTLIVNLLGSMTGNSEYAVTEEEYLEYFFNIISGKEESELRDFLNTKLKDCSFFYLGCRFPNWYARYIVRGITQKRYKYHNVEDNFLIDESIKENVSDEKFLKSFRSIIVDGNAINTIFSNAQPGVIEKARSHASTFINTLYNAIVLKQIPVPAYVGQVFISYYFEDKDKSERLNNELIINKIDTWIDTTNLPSGEHESEIRKKIKKCKIFLCVISANLLEQIEKNAPPYSVSVEWDEIQARLIAETYQSNVTFKIIPCILEGVQRNDERIPSFLKRQHIYEYPAEKEKIINETKNNLSQSESNGKVQ